MKKIHKILFAGLLILMTSCGSTDLSPALRPASQRGDEASRLLIEKTLAEMLNDSSVLIGDEAFFNESEIIIERINFTDNERDRVLGRNLEVPVHFKLWKDADFCFLEYVETGELMPIPELRCIENI